MLRTAALLFVLVTAALVPGGCDGREPCIAGEESCGGEEPVCPLPDAFDQSCTTASDCVIVVHSLDCCGGGRLSAVHASAGEAFFEAQSPCTAALDECPMVDCYTPFVADDGSEVSGPSQVNGECTNSVCQAVGVF